MDDDRPFGHNTVTLPALFIPEGNPDNISAADILSKIGPHAVTFPALFIPDGYDGPRPGYPWIEFGRMTLPGRPAAGRGLADRGASAPDVTSAGVSQWGASNATTESGADRAALPAPGEVSRQGDTAWSAGSANSGTDGTATWRGSVSDIAAAITAWSALSDPGTTIAALQAVSPANPIVQAFARPDSHTTSSPAMDVPANVKSVGGPAVYASIISIQEPSQPVQAKAEATNPSVMRGLGAVGDLLQRVQFGETRNLAVTGNRRIDETTELLLSTLQGAVQMLGTGSGAAFGIQAHVRFANTVRELDLPGIGSQGVEQSFNLGDLVRYGLAGSIRTDVVLRDRTGAPVAIYDLKTGNAVLTPARVRELREAIGVSGIPVIELRYVDQTALPR